MLGACTACWRSGWRAWRAACQSLILLEDARRADAATIDFLTMLVDRIARLKVLLLITHRPKLKAPWARAKNAVTIPLDPLDATTGAQLLAKVVRNHVLPPSVVSTDPQEGGGRPVWVEELARTVLDTMPSLKSSPESFEALTIPATLQNWLMARLDRLGQAKELAQIGSIIGRDCTAAMCRRSRPIIPTSKSACGACASRALPASIARMTSSRSPSITR